MALPSARAATPQFRAVTIDAGIRIGYGLAVADINGDARPDIVLVDQHEVAWYENPGWRKHMMTEKLTPRDHVCVAARDIDGDGKAEVAVGAEWNPGDTQNSGAVFYLHPPADRTQRWEAIRLHHEPTVHRMHWVRSGSGAFELVVLPLHGRGNRDGQGDGVKILAYSRPAGVREPWRTRLLDDTLHKTHNFEPVEWIPGEGEAMLVAGREGVFLLDPGTQPKLTRLGGGEPGAGEIRWGRRADGRRFIATIEPMHGHQTVVYDEPPAGRAQWPRTVIDDALIDGHAVVCADFLKAGHDQIVAGWRAMNQRDAKVGLKLYARSGERWESHLIDDNTMACEDLKAADLNGDGRIDLAAAGRATRNVVIYWNETPAP